MPTLLAITCLALTAHLTHAYNPDEFIHTLGSTIWGFWGQTEACETGSYAFAFELSVETEHGLVDDNTSVNGIKLYCQTPDGHRTNQVTSDMFDRGTWTGGNICSGFLTGYDIRVANKQGALGDNTAANNLRMYCQRGDYLEAAGNHWGHWLGDSHCRTGMAICGLMTRIQPNQGSIGDDTALNDVRFLCCDLPTER